MRVLVYPHDLAIGGSQLNAIDLASQIGELGHDAVVYGIPGPLAARVEEKGIPFFAAHPMQYRPAPSRIWQLARLVRRERIDLIHAYEWPPCLDAFYGAHLVGGVPLVCTVLSMSVSPLVPRSVPLIMGTPQLGAQAEAQQGGLVSVVEPPIDVEHDHPRNDGSAFRRQHSIGVDDLLVVTVSRLSIELKLDALSEAIDAAGRLADRYPMHLLVVGDGPAAPQLQTRAELVNERAGRSVVRLVGPMLDPRPAYAAADVVVGMGSSALRGMAHAKPVVVQGELGFSEVFDRTSAPMFLWQGMYGVGTGGRSGEVLASQMVGLLDSHDHRRRVGDFGLGVVRERYSLQAAASSLVDIYGQAAARQARAPVTADALRVGVRALGAEVRAHRPCEKRARRNDEAMRLQAAACPRR
ncbi:MAG: glycosyltransferase family 4 protein [Acidimicrobiales bacterium]